MADASRSLLVPKGFRAGSVKAGIKPSGLPDLAVFVADGECSAAGLFTTNRIAAAPVQWCRPLVPSKSIRGIAVNAGNANAATGAEGLANAAASAERLAAKIGCEAANVLVASTGIIGRQLPMPRVLEGIDAAYAELASDPAGFESAARAIMTTDTVPKFHSVEFATASGTFRLLGIAKGAAMMGPKMATMLAFLFTDAPVAPADLKASLEAAVEDSFHCISVEGHMSTNDTVLALARARDGAPRLGGADLALFNSAVSLTCQELARMIPADGEGATHLITIDVAGCRTRDDAFKIAKAVAESALVKTAIAGADPNWGRIVSAAGYAGVDFQETDLSLVLNGVPLYREGAPVPFDEALVSRSIRAERETSIRLELKAGEAAVRFWTCDLTAEYVHINADYTT